MALEVIGAGLGRTGTASIKVALERLGMHPCYHMLELLNNPAHMDFWLSAADGTADWETLFSGYSAAVDQPACLYWLELAEYYPAAKVLLSVRDADSWFDSTQQTIFAPAFREHIRETPFGRFLERIVWRDLSAGIDDRAFMTSYFEQRIEQIKKSIPPERLLIYEVADGWEPLCDFLGVAVPEEPFPHINSRDETRQALEAVMQRSPDDVLGVGQDYANDIRKRTR